LNLAALDLITEIPTDIYDMILSLHPWARNANYLPCTRRTQQERRREATFLAA
jgi:hypothetical protein